MQGFRRSQAPFRGLVLELLVGRRDERVQATLLTGPHQQLDRWGRDELLDDLRRRRGCVVPRPGRQGDAQLGECCDGQVFDFHALRGQFITNLARAGVELQMAQKLARHSTPTLTANSYTKLHLADKSAAVAHLPKILAAAPAPMSRVAE